MALVELEGLEVASANAVLVDGVGLRLDAGRVHALVGESGSGKTLTALALGGLTPEGLQARWTRLLVDGALITPAQVPSLRGRTLALMPQDALGALDPLVRVGAQIDEVLEHVAGVGAEGERAARRLALLAEVGFTDAPGVAARFPHQLSGGMRQRALLATTLAANPKLLLADEPTTALDASLRANVLFLLRELASRRGLALLLITHDLGAAAAIADEVTVLYAGRIAEQGQRARVFGSPRHPYTAGLLASRLDAPQHRAMPGGIPGVDERPAGCRFRPRCPRAEADCERQPALVDGVACHHPLERP